MAGYAPPASSHQAGPPKGISEAHSERLLFRSGQLRPLHGEGRGYEAIASGGDSGSEHGALRCPVWRELWFGAPLAMPDIRPLSRALLIGVNGFLALVCLGGVAWGLVRPYGRVTGREPITRRTGGPRNSEWQAWTLSLGMAVEQA